MGNSIVYPDLRPTEHNRYLLLTEYLYKDTIIPVNYTTNGADIPRFLWWCWCKYRAGISW